MGCQFLFMVSVEHAQFLGCGFGEVVCVVVGVVVVGMCVGGCGGEQCAQRLEQLFVLHLDAVQVDLMVGDE